MSKQMIISIMSKDRPGIIASITGAIYSLEGDVADLNQTVLCGYLTMILRVSFAKQVTKKEILAAISRMRIESGFQVAIEEIPEEEKQPNETPAQDSYILTVQGPNTTGIVHGVSQLCFQCQVNISDLATVLNNTQYTMALQLDLQNANCSLDEFRKKIDEYSRQSGLTMMMMHNDIFKITNEVTLH